MIKPGPQTLGASLVDELVKNRHAMQETPVWFLGWEDLLEKSIGYSLQYSWASLMAHLVKDLPAMQETWVQWLGWEDPLEKGTATHSNILAWRIAWTLQSMEAQTAGHNEATFIFTRPIYQNKRAGSLYFNKLFCTTYNWTNLGNIYFFCQK